MGTVPQPLGGTACPRCYGKKWANSDSISDDTFRKSLEYWRQHRTDPEVAPHHRFIPVTLVHPFTARGGTPREEVTLGDRIKVVDCYFKSYWIDCEDLIPDAKGVLPKSYVLEVLGNKWDYAPADLYDVVIPKCASCFKVAKLAYGCTQHNDRSKGEMYYV